MSDPVSLLPPATTAFERALEAVTARAGGFALPLGSLTNPATCPPQVLPFLAWALSVDSWNPDWDLTTKRAVVGAAIDVQGRKGTPAAVLMGLRALGLNPSLEEWFDYGGSPYRFRLDIDTAETDLSVRALAVVDATIDALKNLRSRLELLRLRRTRRAAMRVGTAGVSHERVSVLPHVAPVENHAAVATGTASLVRERVSVLPHPDPVTRRAAAGPGLASTQRETVTVYP